MLQTTLNRELSFFSTEEGIEIVIDLKTGESFATKNGYLRMGKVSRPTINNRLKNTEEKTVEKHRVQTKKGMQESVLIPESTILEWLEKDNPSLLTQFAKLGLRMTLHKWAGVDFTQKEPEPAQKSLEAKDRIEIAKMCADFWKELDLFDDRDRLLLKDYTQNAIVQSDQKYLSEAKDAEIAISNRVTELGYKANNGILKRIGMRASKEYQKLKGETPPKRDQYVDGAPRKVNTYHSSDLPMIDQIIHDFFKDNRY